jgi:hypothetical protein
MSEQPPKFRIELTRKEGWALLDFVRTCETRNDDHAKTIDNICEKVRNRMGLKKEKYGE